MAKKVSKRMGTAKRGAQGATYSTRLTPEQGEVMESAAKELNMAPAKFIREACIFRAQDVLNSSSDRDRAALIGISQALWEKLLNPKIRFVASVFDQPVEWESDYKRLKDMQANRLNEVGVDRLSIAHSPWMYSLWREILDGDLDYLVASIPSRPDEDYEQVVWDYICDPKMVRLVDTVLFPMNEAELSQLTSALRLAGGEFVRIILDSLTALQTGQSVFQPRIDAKRLLAGDE